MNRIAYAVIIGLCFLVAGCGPDPEIISSKQVLSPDKKTIATALILYWDSYPGGIPSSAVRLQDAEHPKAMPVEILTFVQESLYDCYIDPRWLDNTHLDVGYRGCGLDLQAVKAWGITISVHYITK